MLFVESSDSKYRFSNCSANSGLSRYPNMAGLLNAVQLWVSATEVKAIAGEEGIMVEIWE